MLAAIVLFIIAGLAEIGGGYLIWLWLRESKSEFPTFGRVYAAYGGVFVVLALLWGWWVDKKSPDLFDWIGGFICIIGVSVMLWAPRS